MWRKILAVVWTVCIVTVATVACVGFVTKPEPFDPFGTFVSPQVIIDAKPVYRPGDTVFVNATKCYQGSDPIAFSGTSYWRREKPYRLLVQKASGFGVIAPVDLHDGCVTHTFGNVIPDDLPDGVWRIEGQETARKGRDQVTGAWYTESFRVRAKH